MKERKLSSINKRPVKRDVPVAEFPSGIDSELAKAVEHHQQGQLATAERIYKKILRINPRHSDCLCLLGVIARQHGEYDVAVHWINEAIRTSPKNTAYHNELGCAYLDQGKLDEAIPCYQKALQLEPNDADVNYNMGNALKEGGRSDEAIAYYRKALKIEPNDAAIYNNMGMAFKDKGELDEAIACYRDALRLKPHYAAASYNMGMALQEKGKLKEAITFFRRVIDLEPKNVSARHLLAALTGKTTEIAPRQYVAELFDEYSKRFDQHLLKELRYETPRLLRQSLNSLVNEDACFRNTIDLGCGSGLSGIEFRTISDRLCGVDISPRMLAEANKKGIYDLLQLGDVVEYLNDTDEKYDLFVAADVFTYIGNLEPIFAAVRKCTLGPAYFLFSTESCDRSHYVLRQTGRYAHSVSYIQLLAKKHDFVIKTNQSAALRKEGEESVIGNLFIIKYVG
jgi:predicted TPR repeat methyltransferase